MTERRIDLPAAERAVEALLVALGEDVTSEALVRTRTLESELAYELVAARGAYWRLYEAQFAGAAQTDTDEG